MDSNLDDFFFTHIGHFYYFTPTERKTHEFIQEHHRYENQY